MRRNPVLSAAAVALGLLIFALVIVFPRGREVGGVESEVNSAATAVAELKTQLAILKATPPTDVAAELASVRVQIPSSAEIPALLRSLRAAAEVAGVSFGGVTLSPGGPAVASSVYTIPLAITVEGGYFELARFLFETEHLDRLIRVSTVSISVGGAGPGNLSMSVAAEAYTTDPSVGPGADPAPGPEVGA